MLLRARLGDATSCGSENPSKKEAIMRQTQATLMIEPTTADRILYRAMEFGAYP